MRNDKKNLANMLVISTLLLAGCASTPTLDFPIPPDKIGDFNECMIPKALLSELNKDDDKFWPIGLPKSMLENLATSLPKMPKLMLENLATSLPEMLNMLYADTDKLTVPDGKHLLSVPFDMNRQWFPFFDSKMVDAIQMVSDSANFSLLLQPESKFQEAATTIPGRIAKALKAYLLAYFTVRPDAEGNIGFISRDGTKFQFPVEIDSISGNNIQALSSVDHSQVGADIIRIFLEAIRDGSLDECEALPAIDPSATGVKARLLRFFKNDRDSTNKECVRKWKIPPERLSIIQTRANAAESMIATAAGKAMRGGSMGSLNNEALARAAETATGVMARHTAERVEWCRASVE